MTVNRAGIGVRNIGTVGSTPRESRLSMAALLAEASNGVPRQGLLYQNDPLVVRGSTSTAPMTYLVGPCSPVITRTPGEGVYQPTFTDSTAVPASAAPGSGFRYDLIWVKQNDPDKGDPDNKAYLGVTEGIAGSSPARPTASVPAGAYILAEALVPAGATTTNATTITPLWQHTAPRGAAIPVRNTEEREGVWARPGASVLRLDQGGALERYVNSAWGVREIVTAPENGWANVAGALPLRVEIEGKSAELQGYITRSSGTSTVITTLPTEARPRKDVTWATVAQNNPGTNEGPGFRFYISASSGQVSINRLEGGPAWNNGGTLIPVSIPFKLP